MTAGQRRAAVEKWMAVGGFVVGAVLGWFLYCQVTMPKDSHKELLQAMVTFASILTGFVTAIKAIIVSMPESRVMEYLRSQGGIRYNRFLEFSFTAINLSVVLVLISCIGFALDLSEPSQLHRVAVTLWWGVLGGACCALFRFYRIVREILKA